MRPPAAAQQIANTALSMLPAVDRARAVLPAKIAGGELLTDDEIEQCRTVLAAGAGGQELLLAQALLGGGPMQRAVAAAATSEEAAGEPDPGPHTGAMIALIPTDVDLGYLDLPVSDGLPADDLHITLAYLGPADQIDDNLREQIVRNIESIAGAAGDPIPVTFGHLEHFGPADEPAAIAYAVTSPELHYLRQTIVTSLDDDGIEWSDTYAFRPHMTITYVDRAAAEADWPPGPLSSPATLLMTKLLVRFGEDVEEIFTIGAPPIDSLDRTPRQPTSPVTAAARSVGLPVLSSALDALNADLRSIESDVAVEVRAAVDFGWRSALDRVGRMATRTAVAAGHVGYRDLEPAVVATSADLSAVNVDALIEPAISDVAAHVQRVVGRAQQATLAGISDSFAVDLDGVFPEPADVGNYVIDRMTAALQSQLGRLGDIGRIDPSDGDHDPLIAPYSLTRDVLAFAGGADVLDSRQLRRDTIGRPMQAQTAGADSVPLGPGPVAAVRDAIMSHRNDGAVTAAARRRAGAEISDALRSDLADAAARMAGAGDAAPLEQVTVHTWRLNYNGRAIENLPRHEKLAGTTVTAEADLQQLPAAQTDPSDWPGVPYSHPGDHRYCHCGWETRIELRPVQLALPVQ